MIPLTLLLALLADLPASSPTVLELFAGAGGAALGLRRAGFQARACLDWNPAAVATLRAAGFPGVEDDVLLAELASYRGVDLLWASPPCQPGSLAGKRAGGVDPRSGWGATLRAVDMVQPRFFCAENVQGYTKHDVDHSPGCPGCEVDAVEAELRKRFAAVGRWCLDAASYGVPQHRRRMFLWGAPFPLHAPEMTHGGHGQPPFQTMGDAIGSSLARGPRVVYPPGQGRAASEPRWLTRPAPTVMTTEEKGTRAHAPDWTMNMGPDRASDAAFLALGVRRLTTREAATLQGFPPDYPWQGNVHDVYTQVGNAVPPALAEAVGSVFRRAFATGGSMG